MSNYIVFSCFLPLSSQKEKLERTSTVLTKRKDKSERETQTDRLTDREDTSPHRERRRRREKGSTRERTVSKWLPVHLPFPSMNMSENELSVEVCICSSLEPSSFWLPCVSILLNVIPLFTHLSRPFISGGGGRELSIITLQHRPVASSFRQPNQEQSVLLLGSFKRFKKIILNRKDLSHLS